MFEADTTVHSELRSGLAPWMAGRTRPSRKTLATSRKCDILIVGAGITGTLMAENLTALGHKVCIIDRERPGFGSTAASTAMLQWEIDCSLTELTEFYGFETASALYRRSLEAVTGLKRMVHALRLNCSFRDRSSLYMAGPDTDPRELLDEHKLRQRAGLPGTYLDAACLKDAFGFKRSAAICSPGSADADPLLLSHALMGAAVARGAEIYDANATAYDALARHVMVGLDNGCEIEAKTVILATGYVMPDFVNASIHKTASSWAIATPPQDPDVLWREGALVWEASEPYLYARTTIDNRIIVGGEDDDQVVEPASRDALAARKTATILRKLRELCPGALSTADYEWSGAFGETEDGLPLIGPVPGQQGIYAAYGYGGNGITYSFLASRVIADMMSGSHEPWHDDLAINRPSPKK